MEMFSADNKLRSRWNHERFEKEVETTCWKVNQANSKKSRDGTWALLFYAADVGLAFFSSLWRGVGPVEICWLFLSS